jgi:hypothetical protein
MTTTESQNSKILRHLESGGTLTPYDALTKFGTLRLAARIKNLKDLGYRIHGEMVSFRNGKRAAQYRLAP